MPSVFQKTLGPVTLGAFNIGAAAAGSAMVPLLAHLNLMLVDPFGIGALKADFVAQFKAQVNFSVTFSDPITLLKQAISSVLQVVASLQVALALGLPPMGIQISASLGMAAALQARIAGINLLIDATLGVRLVGVNFLALLNAAISAGPVVAYGWSGITMATLQAELAAYPFAVDGFLPFNPVSGVMVMTKD